MQAKQQVPT